MSASSATAAVLAVGTELTTGQIVNRNAAWLSERLGELGFEVVLHETVADDREEIALALDRCASRAAAVFVTGGLGPTSDDFTREVISLWSGAPLEYDEPSWSRIEKRLRRLGIPVAQSNRQQCWFPRGALVLENPQGTASGFALDATPSTAGAPSRLWVLPGPPHEIAAIWEHAGIPAQLSARFPGLKRLKLLTWQCIGKSEAELGELTETVLAGSGLKTGYRAHRPYVEIKAWYPEGELDRHRASLERLEAALGAWVVARNGEDVAENLLSVLQRSDDIRIFDSATSGILSERLGAHLRKPAWAELGAGCVIATEFQACDDPEAAVARTLEQSEGEGITLVVAGFSPRSEWAIGLRDGVRVRQQLMVSPYSSLELLDRARRHAAELSITIWRSWLSESMQ